MKKGEKMSEEQKEKIRQSNLGKKHNISKDGLEALRKSSRGGWNRGIKCDIKWINNIRLSRIGKTTSDKQKSKARQIWLGKNNPRWVGGKQFWKENEKKHLSSKYILWMKEVKTRDKWKCKMSSYECKGKLEAHHILPWRTYPELRYEINNGITLCRFHHPRKHTEENRLMDTFRKLIDAIK